MHFRPIFTLTISFLAALPLAAQESQGTFRRILDRMISPPSHLDSSYVLEPRPRWNVSLSPMLRRTGVSQDLGFELNGQQASLALDLEERLYNELGLSVGYGSLSVGFSHEIGLKSAVYNKSFSLDFMGACHGFQVSYYDIRQPMTYSLTMGESGTADWLRYDGMSEYLGRMKMLIADALYAFNRSTFAYCAAYRGNKIQRHPAGSWVVCAKYLQGEVTADPQEPISNLIYGLNRQATAQGSVGAGYSYNFVPYHRQDPGSDIKGLRNLTVNLTLLPLLTFYDRHVSTRYVINPATGDYSTQETHPLKSTLRLNFLTRMGVGYTRDRFFMGLSGRYDVFSFRGTTKIVGSGVSEDIKTAGHFSKWTAVLTFNVKF